MDATPEIGNEMAERTRFPALVERFEALGDAVGGRRDLVGVDRVKLAARVLRVPEDQGAPADRGDRSGGGRVAGRRFGQGGRAGAGMKARGLDLVHRPLPIENGFAAAGVPGAAGGQC
jgi:hypothetical protein